MDEDDDFTDPYNGYDDDDPCDHDGHDVDILTGRAHCHRCGEAWWLSSERLQAELTIQAELAEAYQQEADEEERLRLENEEME